MTNKQKNSFQDQQLFYYLGGLASWWVGLGLQLVMIPYVVSQELHETSHNLGVTQMCTLLPAFLFILHAGITADRFDCRSILLILHILAFIPSLGLALMIDIHQVNLYMVIVYALAMGTLSAYNSPTRDALLRRVSKEDMQKAVSRATAVQFTAQTVGFIFAATASYIGDVEPLFFMQAIVMFSGSFFMYKIKPIKNRARKAKDASQWELLKEGFKTVSNHAPMRLVALLNILVGLIFMGSIMVAVPLIVRDTYRGESIELSVSIMSFYIGVIVASLLLNKLRKIRNIGIAIVSMMATGAFAMLLMTLHLPFFLFLFLIFIWGIAVGFVFTLGRTVVQEAAPATHQARALSIYQIGITGGAPLGSLAIGFLAHNQGALEVLYLPAFSLLGILLFASFFTDLLKINLHKPTEEPVLVEVE